MKTQFQSYTLDLSENKNSTVFNSNIKVTDGPLAINNENEIVTLNVTKASTFKKGIDVTENIQNHGTLNQEGVSKIVSGSTFTDNVNLVDYVKNPNTNTNTQQTIIPILKIATTQTGNKIVLYNKNYDVNLNPYICGISIYQDAFSTTSAYMDYYCNSGLKSGHRFYGASTKILDLSVTSLVHLGKTAIICADSNLNSGFQFENNKANEISLLFKSYISDSVSDLSIVVSITSKIFTANSEKMVVTSGELELTSNRISQIYSGSYSTSYVNSNQLINISKIKSIYTNISDMTTLISSNNTTFEDSRSFYHSTNETYRFYHGRS